MIDPLDAPIHVSYTRPMSRHYSVIIRNFCSVVGDVSHTMPMSRHYNTDGYTPHRNVSGGLMYYAHEQALQPDGTDNVDA